jgi:hypothetical protein
MTLATVSVNLSAPAAKPQLHTIQAMAPKGADLEYSDPETDDLDESAPSETMCLSDYRTLIISSSLAHEQYFGRQPWEFRQKTESDRYKVIEWLMNATHEMEFEDETIMLTVSLFDQITATGALSDLDSQLLAGTCLWIASKLEEHLTPSVRDFVYLCTSAYEASDFIACEHAILHLLHFSVASTTPIFYVQSALQVHVADRPHLMALARFFCLTFLFCPPRPRRHPAVVGLSSVFLAALAICSTRIRTDLAISPPDVLAIAHEMLSVAMDIGQCPDHPLHADFPRCTRSSIADLTRMLLPLVTITRFQQVFDWPAV